MKIHMLTYLEIHQMFTRCLVPYAQNNVDVFTYMKKVKKQSFESFHRIFCYVAMYSNN